MKRITYLFFILASLIGCLFVKNISACSCYVLPPIYQAYETSDAVFIGKVISSNAPKDRSEYQGGDIIFNIEVIENFKGAKGKEIKLDRGSMSSSCYSGYTIGETYLFYASEKNNSGFFDGNVKGENIVYQGSFCNRTTNLRDGQDQIFFIREMLAGKPEPQIYGSVGKGDSEPNTFDWRYQYLSGIKVILKGDNGQIETKTDKNGIFRFNNIPQGEYILTTSPPQIYKTYFPEEEFFQILPDKRIYTGRSNGYPTKSFYAHFGLGWNNKFEGNILDINGKPLSKCVIEFLPEAKKNDVMIPNYNADGPDNQREDGSFFFNGKTPGKYVLAVEIYTPSPNGLKKRFFYPSTENPANAQVFDIIATTKIQNIQFKVPVITRQIKGTITWSDGTSLGRHGWFVLTKLEDSASKENTMFNWNSSAETGEFSIQAFDGFDYFLHLSVSYYDKEKNSKTIKIEPMKVKVGENLEDLKIVVEKPADFACMEYDCKK